MVDLYRIYDRSRRLLYIGISGNAGERADQHARTKPWWPQVDHITVQHLHCDREDALRLEEWAIRAERPKYNIQHNVVDRYVMRPVPVEPYSTPHSLLASPVWHRFKRSLRDLCNHLMDEQMAHKVTDLDDVDLVGLVRSLMLAAHQRQWCPKCGDELIPDIVRLDRSSFVSTSDRRFVEGDTMATVVGYCEPCNTWARPERKSMDELVSEPRSYSVFFPTHPSTPYTEETP